MSEAAQPMHTGEPNPGAKPPLQGTRPQAAGERGGVVRILGIDPGLQTTGFGVIDVIGSKLCYVASGVIETTKGEMGNLPARLKVIYEGVREIHARYQPDVASVEITFMNVNPQASLMLGQARGCCVTALVSCDLAVAEYTALQMKQAITGHGRAAKSQVQEMVKRLLQLPAAPRQDAADALGLAITHAHASPSMNKLAAQGLLKRKTHGMYRAGRSH